MNTYAYVEGNPLRFIDPQGLAIGDFPPPPPGYDPKTWTQGQYQNNGRIYLRDPSGRIWIVHPEDKGHWRHWDKRGGGDDGRWPPNSKKTWPNQKKPAKPDQCKEDPSGDAPPWEPLDPEEIAIEGDPILDPLMPFSPFNPFNPNWGRGPSPVRVPPIRVPVFVP